MIHTRLTDVLGISHPILLAPMANVAGGLLATAVSEAGGLGLIGGGYGDEVWVRRELAQASFGMTGIGFITWNLPVPSPVVEHALAQSPRAVMLSFGDPSPFLPAIREAGCPLILQVQSVEDAMRAVDWGAAVVVAQGTEAGGHGASRGTLPLVRAVVEAVNPVPVVAAGGIADGRGIAAALMLGAAGALIGTRLMVSEEALIPQRAKARLVESRGDDTVRSTVFDIIRGRDWPKPFTGRSLRNAFTERWHGNEDGLRAALPSAGEEWHREMEAENFDEGLIFAGEGLDMIKTVLPAGEIVRILMAETEAALREGASLAGN